MKGELKIKIICNSIKTIMLSNKFNQTICISYVLVAIKP